MNDLRLSDAERKAALKRLTRHRTQGRIDDAELAARSDAIRTARTYGDLEPVFADLEGVAGPRPRPVRYGPGPWRRGGFGIPFFPLVLILVVVAIATHTPWVLIGIPALWLLTAPLRWRRRAWRHGWAC